MTQDLVSRPLRVAPAAVPTHHRGWWRMVGGLLLLAVLVHQLGAGPFSDGVRAARPWAVIVALVLTAGTTWCCAVRWSLVSARFNDRVPVRAAYAAYYRSQLINATVPGGVVGDLHRGLRFGWRGVLWDRGIGQVVQAGLVGALLLPGGWRWAGLAVVLVGVCVGGAVAVLSVLSTSGHLVVFLVAATAAGAGLPLTTLVPIGALVLLGSAIPLNLAGWGPREGIATLAFTAYGSTAATGLTVAVTFGILSTLATLPGLLVLGGRRD